MARHFSYLFRRFPTQSTEEGFILRPMVPTRMSWMHGNPIDVEMLLDSGADFSMIPVDLAEALGVDFGECERDTATGINGTTNIATTEVDCTINYHGFSASLVIPMHIQLDRDANFLPMLGREPVFRRFDVSFRLGHNWPQGKFVMTESICAQA